MAWATTRSVRLLVIVSVFLAAPVGGAAEPGGAPASRPRSRPAPIVLPLAERRPAPIRAVPLDQLRKRFGAFRHAPYATAGFNHFTLPFRYSTTDESGDLHETFAFSFLLSNSLDWTPGCYCARHVYFVFKRQKKEMWKLAHAYDEKLIRFLVNDWSATHAVGGALVRSQDGFAGTLEIYDRDGKKVLSRAYAKARGFFELLGDMSVDAMKFFGHTPNKALTEYLHRKRARHDQSIVALGKACYAKARTDEEFELYRAILKRDPDFADVRYWWSNQKYWRDGDKAHYNLHKALSLKSYLTEAALTDFEPDECPDKALAAKFEGWVAAAERLVGPHAPPILRLKLAEAADRYARCPELFRRALPVAAKFPNSHWLCLDLARVSYWCAHDVELAVSILLSNLQNRYLVGQGGRNRTLSELIFTMQASGLDPESLPLCAGYVRSAMEGDRRDRAAWPSWRMGTGLRALGRYGEAVPWYLAALAFDPEARNRDRNATEAAIVAALAGQEETFRASLNEHGKAIAGTGAGFIVDAYGEVLGGRLPDAKELDRQTRACKRFSWVEREGYRLCAQIEMLAGKQRYRGECTDWLRWDPDYRPDWRLFDAYDRRRPQPEGAAFYDAVEWLYPDDPWVRRAVADRRRRLPKARAMPPEQVLARLADFTPARWPAADRKVKGRAQDIVCALPPGAPTAAARRLVAAGRFDKARELALRYHHLCVDANVAGVRRAIRLLRRIDRAAEAAGTATAPASRPAPP